MIGKMFQALFCLTLVLVVACGAAATATPVPTSAPQPSVAQPAASAAVATAAPAPAPATAKPVVNPGKLTIMVGDLYTERFDAAFASGHQDGKTTADLCTLLSFPAPREEG